MTHPEYAKQVKREEIIRVITLGLLIFSMVCMFFFVAALI